MARKKKMFRKFNPPPGTTPLVVGALAIGLTAGGIYFYSRPAKAKPKKSCAPYKYSSKKVRASIEAEIDAGSRDPLSIAVVVATEHYGQHPTAGAVTFPPEPGNAPKGVSCVWDKVVALVAKIFDEKGIDPDGGEEEEGGVQFVIHDAYDEGYPWEEASLQSANYPTPGTFADVGGDQEAFKYNQGPLAVAQAALNSAIAMAASKGHDVSVAQEIMGKDTAKRRDLLAQMNDLIYGSTWNDALFGREVDQAEKGTDKNLYGWVCTGRSPLFLPQHNDVLGQLALGEAPRRAISAKGVHKSGNNYRQPAFWIPAIDLARLAGPKPAVTTDGMTWSDGSSTREPPPVVQRFGINLNGVALPGGPGCS